MKVQEHLGKITWSLADKALYMIYGVVQIIQFNYSDLKEVGIFGMLIAVHTWIFILADSLGLSGIIQFGSNKEDRPQVNYFSLMILLFSLIPFTFIFYLFRNVLADIFALERLKDIGLALPILTILTIPRIFGAKFCFRDYKMKSLFFINLLFFGPMVLMTFYYINTIHFLSFKYLVIIYFIGTGISSAYTLFTVRKELKFSKKGNLTLKQIFNFSFPFMITNVFYAFPKYLDFYIIKLFFPIESVGLYFSAKTLYRVFDETLNAAVGLFYPSAVKQLKNNNRKELMDLMSKASSFLCMFFLGLVLFFELGASKWLIHTFLPARFYDTVPLFNMLILSSLMFPLVILLNVVTADNKPKLVLKSAIVSCLVFVITIVIIGLSGNYFILPLATILFMATYGSFGLYYASKLYDYKLVSLLRAITDSLSYIKHLKAKR